MLARADAERLRDCVASGGIAVIPTDTVYGLACDPDESAAIARIYELKGRPPARPSAVIFFDLAGALASLPELEQEERAAVRALLPGPVTVLLQNRAGRFPLACRPDAATLGLRVPRLDGDLAALAAVGRPLLQTSANLSGGADPRSVADIPESVRRGVDLVLDAGELPGRASSVVDLSQGRGDRSWGLIRQGAASAPELEVALASAGWAIAR